MQTVSTESVSNDHDQPQPNCRKKVIIAGDSTLKYLQSHKMSRNSQVKIATFPGCTTQDMKDHIKSLLRRNPDEIIIHAGTNSLRSSNSPRECAEEVVDLAKLVSSESPAMITISSLISRSDDEALLPRPQSLAIDYFGENGGEGPGVGEGSDGPKIIASERLGTRQVSWVSVLETRQPYLLE